MVKIYRDRALQVDKEDFGDKGQSLFFFPKNNPPVAVLAKTIEEAEEILKEKTEEIKSDNKKEI